jgi:HEPN domain-containing protein
LSPSPEQIEYAEMLHRLATGDLYACRKLADDAEVDDHIIGFHAQQAVEKALKVALVLADSELPHTHDLELLVEQIKEAGTTVPDELSRTEWLTPWAAELRYDERIALDRKAALAAAESASGWAASLLADAKRPQPEPDPGRNSREEAPPAPES